jgi:hypothetical protein
MQVYHRVVNGKWILQRVKQQEVGRMIEPDNRSSFRWYYDAVVGYEDAGFSAELGSICEPNRFAPLIYLSRRPVNDTIGI